MEYKCRKKQFLKKWIMMFTFCAAFIMCKDMREVHAKAWYESYDYLLDNNTKTITLISSDGTLGETTTIPASVTIGEVSYAVILDNSTFRDGSLWNKDKDTLTSLTIQSGVKAAAGCHHLFFKLSKLKNLDVSGLDTSAMTDMSYMFEGCTELLYLDLSGFNTKNVTTMLNMFSHCIKLVYIDLSSFNTDKVKEMSNMFGDSFGDQMLQDLDLRSLNMSQGDTSFDGFLSKAKIVNLYLPKKNCIKNYDMSGMSNLARIYFEGTEAEWNNLNNTVKDGVKVIYDYTAKETPTEPEVANPNTSKWYESYEYVLDKKNYKLIIMKSKGGITSAEIPAYTTIDDKTYKTVLNNYNARRATPLSLWASDVKSLNEIKIADGVELAEKSDALFRKLKFNNLEIGDVSDSKLVSIQRMFSELTIRNLDLRKMDMSDVTNIKYAFDGANITNLYLPINAIRDCDLSTISGLTNIFYAGTEADWASLNNTIGSIPITYNYDGPVLKITTVTVSFDGNGGTPSKTSMSVTYDEEYGELPTATRNGYIFTGWYTEVTDGKNVTATTKVDTNLDHTLYARWTEDKTSTTVDQKQQTNNDNKNKTTTGTQNKNSDNKSKTSTGNQETNNSNTGETVTVTQKTIKKESSVILSLKQTKTGRKLKVKYNKFKGATGYQIQYSTSKKFKKKTSINAKKTTATTRKLKKGKRYYVRVRAYIKSGKKKYYSKWSKVKRSAKIK